MQDFSGTSASSSLSFFSLFFFGFRPIHSGSEKASRESRLTLVDLGKAFPGSLQTNIVHFFGVDYI